MKLKTVFLSTSTAVLLMLSCLSAARADLTTFAQFRESDSSVNAFSFTDSGATSNFHVVNAPVKFSFGVNNGYNGNSTADIDALLSFDATIDGKPTGTGPFTQKFTSVSMTFTATTAVNGKTNLLTVSDSTFTLFGKGNSASTNSSTASGDSVFFGSDFLDFSNTLERDFALSFSSVNPFLSLDLDGYLNSFLASGTGTFASDEAPVSIGGFVPDGSSFSLMSGGLLSLAGWIFYTRRRGRK